VPDAASPAAATQQNDYPKWVVERLIGIAEIGFALEELALQSQSKSL